MKKILIGEFLCFTLLSILWKNSFAKLSQEMRRANLETNWFDTSNNKLILHFFFFYSFDAFIHWLILHSFFLFLTHSMHTLTYWYVKQWWYVLSSSLPDWFSFTHKVPWSGAISVKYKVYNCDHSNYKNYKIKWPLSLWYKNWSHLNCL